MTINNLLALDVSKLVEQKNNLTYLSWAHAWAEALKADPAATFHVDTFQRADGTTVPYMEINGTAMVWVRVTIFGKEATCFLPVMNSRNEPIKIAGRKFKDKYGNEKIEEVDAFNVNTAIMRCMTKALALHGLGLHIYAGEDLPLGSEPEDKNQDKPEKKQEKTEKTNERANAELFADGMVEYVIICKKPEDLKSYWKSNQTSIDNLKSNYPDLFERVRTVFSEMKTKLQEKS